MECYSEDHIIALNNKGEVFAMGDDTYGQCGQVADGRFTSPPFQTKRVTSPQHIVSVYLYRLIYPKLRRSFLE